MRFSQLYAPTVKEAPADAEVVSHALLYRAGFIRKAAAGVYTYLPLAKRTLSKIENIVREEMNKIGAQEISMPIIHPAELWQMTGRWDDYGDEMMKLKDRHGRDFALGPTHEEMVTFLVKDEVRSYKQLPLFLYQIGPKYRDEIRPRFGLLRAREFIMKDGYSFHDSEESLDEAYKACSDAYSKIVERINLKYMIVEAASGAIGGSQSHEFVSFAQVGETNLLRCNSCGYSSSDEQAPYRGEYEKIEEDEKLIQLVHTPNVRTVQQVADFLSVEPKRIVKSLLFVGRNGFVMALIQGDRELNVEKLKVFMKDQSLRLATPDEVFETFKVPIGFVGPVGVNVPIVADHGVRHLKNVVVGGMKEDYHYVNANVGRDFNPDHYTDLVLVVENDPCPVCGKPLQAMKGIELGHVFKLGTKYSQSMGAYYMDREGNLKPFIMGCYGWGVSRTMAAVVEQLNDEDGIIWPRSIAPYEVIVTVVSMNDERQKKFAESLYRELNNKGIEALLDDREISPGMKFKDADLIGFPLRITVGKSLQDGFVELKLRNEKNQTRIEADVSKVVQTCVNMLDSYDPQRGR
ncbi:prolyl-tRNA synthetase [Pseudothermotoga hypogea DSM 11164 = NBRC 106472]|uniref:Proline--tRNA ligase n=1 Tax=Pseudothermotoga hypogea DSM 11164 = NBRC 106472 TaxID=1123384 RepID=A0A0X1KRG2_9THEM|nr:MULTISPECIES: proline--tRNA ligase [Pseudothermotoga]AJC73780.1 prolyl-tRNA synthetase [Pseudothermotoga hypogea DSM 11164 = NBRC 106472]MDI6863575.1 proline--tRNA ligase [Pseudothermotoga sp.]